MGARSSSPANDWSVYLIQSDFPGLGVVPSTFHRTPFSLAAGLKRAFACMPCQGLIRPNLDLISCVVPLYVAVIDLFELLPTSSPFRKNISFFMNREEALPSCGELCRESSPSWAHPSGG